MAKYVVCPECEGEGYVSNIGAFTASDIAADYGDDWGARQDFVEAYGQRGGVYDRACGLCRGGRVVAPGTAEAWEELAEERAEASIVSRYESVGY